MARTLHKESQATEEGYYLIGSRTDNKEYFDKCLLQENFGQFSYDGEMDCSSQKPNWDRLLLHIGKQDTIILVHLVSVSYNIKKTLKILAEWAEGDINYRILIYPILRSFGKFSSESIKLMKILTEYVPLKSEDSPGIRQRDTKGERLVELSPANQLLAKEVSLLYTKGGLSPEEICAKTGIKSKATLYRYLKFMNTSVKSNKNRKANFELYYYQNFKPSKANLIFFSVDILKEFQDQVIDLIKCHPDIFQLMSQLVARATPKM